jgi:hypothetical protein
MAKSLFLLSLSLLKKMRKMRIISLAIAMICLITPCFAAPINDIMKSPKDNMEATFHRDLGQNPSVYNVKVDITDRNFLVQFIPRFPSTAADIISILETAIWSYKDALSIMPEYYGSPYLEVRMVNPADQMNTAATFIVTFQEAKQVNSTDKVSELALTAYSKWR